MKGENKMNGIGNQRVTNLQKVQHVELYTVRYKTEKTEEKLPRKATNAHPEIHNLLKLAGVISETSFESGEYVRVTGLTNQTEHNGSDGMVDSVSNGKVNVKLHNGNMIRIKPTNLEKVEKADVFKNNLFQIACYGKTEDQNQIKYELVVAESLVNRCEYRKVTLSKHDKHTFCETAKDTITTPKMSINFPFWNCGTNNQGEEVTRGHDDIYLEGDLTFIYSPPNIATVFDGTKITDSYNDQVKEKKFIRLKLEDSTIIRLTYNHKVLTCSD